VWDGDSADGLEGVLGAYARWISPHKLSLYILAGMPVICHSDSAAAKLVTQYGIGISVDAISEVADAISVLSEKEYQEMRRRMRPLAERISKGLCLVTALEELSAY
jgi:glycosyltransferase involved in cell wall biosynthesis